MDKFALAKAYEEVEFIINGHGVREVKVLKQALARIEDSRRSDIYGNGSLIGEFEEKLAKYLGKESAVFFPSGTMAQQIALRIWSDEKGVAKVAYHPLAHLEIHEEDGLKELHHLEPLLLADKDRLIELEDVTGLAEDISCLLLELPQREIGGQLPPFETLVDISNYCRANGIKLHLDGARLFEIVPYYQKSAAEISALFDSVYVSFYKGLGGVAGAILAGEKAFTAKSKIWKRRHGGDLISLYPYIISADYYFDQRLNKMEQYYEGAVELASLFNECHGIFTKPHVPVSNMFHVHLSGEQKALETVLIELYEQTGIGFTGNLKEAEEKNSYYFEVSIGDQYADIPKNKLQESLQLLNEKMQSVKGSR